MPDIDGYKTPADYVGVAVVAHRSSRKYAEKYIASFADCLGDYSAWNGRNAVPVHIEWNAVKSPTGGFDIVATTTEQVSA